MSTPELAGEDAARVANWRKAGAVVLPVDVFADGHAQSTGALYFRDWTEPERRQRGIKWWVGLWGLGLCFVFVPILHFVVPPILLVAGPWVAWRMAKVARTVFGGVARCPRCSQPVWLGGGVALALPMRDHCSRCYVAVVLRRPPQDAP